MRIATNQLSFKRYEAGLQIALKRIWEDYHEPFDDHAKLFDYYCYRATGEEKEIQAARDILRLVQILEDIEGPQVRVVHPVVLKLERRGYQIRWGQVGKTWSADAWDNHPLRKGRFICGVVGHQTEDSALRALAGELGVAL